MSQPIRGQGGNLVFPIAPKNTNLVEGLEILLPVKFRWIPFSPFRGEVENFSAYQRPERPSCFSDRLEKHKLGRGCWDLAICQVSLNSVQRFQRRSRKCESLKRTDEGRCAMTIAHSSLRLGWAKKEEFPQSKEEFHPCTMHINNFQLCISALAKFVIPVLHQCNMVVACLYLSHELTAFYGT